MHWILQDNLFNEAAYQTLLDTLVRFNISHSIHKVIPFIGELVPDPGQLRACDVSEFSSRVCEHGTKGCNVQHKNVICMGSYSLRHAAWKAGWFPGVFDLEPFDFTKQLEHWGDHMLNHDSVVCRFEDANFEDELMFIRPIHDSKVFAGKVFDREEFYEWKRKVCVLEEDYGISLTKDTLVQLSLPKKIYAEYRFWIVNQRIVTASLYKRGDRVIYSSDVDRRVYEYANIILKTKNQSTSITLSTTNDGWAPHAAFCLDIADTPEGFKVVEINTLNSCGFYAAQITDLVLSLQNNFSHDK